jgi:hypothetical protein
MFVNSMSTCLPGYIVLILKTTAYLLLTFPYKGKHEFFYEIRT